jgi:hypothetical protein
MTSHRTIRGGLALVLYTSPTPTSRDAQLGKPRALIAARILLSAA